MQKLKLKVPPPVWFVFCAMQMWLLSQALPNHLPDYQNKGVWVLSGIVGGVGLVIALLALITIHKAKTTHSPFQPENTNQIVNWGIYSKSRNPMYLSLLLGLMAWALLLGSIFAWLVVPLFMWLITYFQIKPEEQILSKKFGQSYLDYLSEVRRWL
ncbi:isoprenylcysteine carboxylmethyltransferase family protein [Mannheimia sp. AT1]|uniref:Isoprenylcysteine carboxylmethyltransferase family protein n=1 Tax=Mannheimia cairinae TaxID=3025936 RepID=A0ABT5MPI9_9PAST|nr:isoprenylcysteine carboxylmethyltransferase family protein [Mannheimia cairinae]MDD0824095.1 isoprenylcysteine carboxylmethyltransferase family protein [Mannheimia cairinae]MDD0826800.1 isoprenylcysteine carboxylmethyltransferase family protein [Mannheimia cairinae]